MRNVLSKALLCGVLASTVIMVNCQKAPSRGVRAGTDDGQAKTNVAAKIGTCTDEIIAQLRSRAESIVALNAAIAEANQARSESPDNSIGEPVKQNLLSKASDVAAADSAVVASIQALQVSGAPADGCNGSDIAPNSTAKKDYVIQEMAMERQRLAQAVRGLTGQSSDLDAPPAGEDGDSRGGTPAPEEGAPPVEDPAPPPVEDPAPPPADTPAPPPAETPAPANPESSAQALEAAQVMVVSADLAGVLARTTADSSKYLVSGEIKTGDNQQQTRDAADSTKTLCKVSTSGGELTANAELKVEAIDSDDADGGLKVASVMLNTIPAAPATGEEATPPKTYILSCNVARGVEPAKGVRASLGELVTINAPAAPMTPDAAPPAPPAP